MVNGKTFGMTFAIGMLLAFLLFPIVSHAYAILSIHPVDLVDYDAKLKTRVWWLTVAQNQMSDYAVGTISADQIKDKETGATAEKDLEIRMSVDKQYCFYTIATGEPIYRWDWEKISLDWWKGECNQETAEAKCREMGGVYVTRRGCEAWCFIRTKVGYFGDISTPSLNFQSTITIKAGNEEYKATIDRLSQTEVNFPNDIAYARWTGSLATGDECPKAKEEDVGAVWLYSDGKWHFVDYSDYQTYKIRNDDFLTCINGVDSDSEAQLCVDEVNNALDVALLPKDFTSKGGSEAEAHGTYYNGYVEINLKKLIQYPVINMYVRADWLGVVMPYGMPKIINAYSSPFDPSKGSGYITVEIQNVGKGEGSFGVYAECDYPFSIKSTEYTPTLKPGETASVNLVLVAPTTTKEIKGTCRVIAYDRTHTINRDSTTVTVSAKPLPKGCEDYGYKSTPPVCPAGYKPKTINVNGLVCYTGECEKIWTPPECKWWDITCHIRRLIGGIKEKVESGLMWIGLIAVIIFVLLYVVPALLPKVGR